MNPNEWPNGYRFFPSLAVSRGRYALRPITWEDRTYIRRWRNEQISVLRQQEPLSLKEQNQYFRDVVATQMHLPKPAQVLVGYLEDDSLVGYGGLVHILWDKRSAEVSFLLSPQYVTPEETYRQYHLQFLTLIKELAFAQLGFLELTTETYAHRVAHMRNP